MPVDLTRPNSSVRNRKVSKREPEDDGLDSSRARDQELKRSRGEISCAECRRLKIKCDKLVPCTSCSRRGCAALCPNGSLATGQGTRFVLAATEHLHKRIAKMTERIRLLEDALQMLQAKITTDPHPLLAGEAAAVTQSLEEEPMEDTSPPSTSEIIDSLGTLSMSEHGVSRFFGPTGGTEYLLFYENETLPGSPIEGQSPRSGRSSMTPPIGSELTRFSSSFPFTPIGSPPQVKILIQSYLPSWERALHLADSYVKNCAWLFQGVTKEQLLDEMLPSIYKRPGVEEPNEYDGPHDLALLFLTFALGAVVDLTQEPYSAEGEHYHHLARAALCLQPVLEKPTLVTIQALRLLSIYNAMSGLELPGSETTMETTWSVSSLASQLGQSIGLHRDSAKWGLSKLQVERRRILFWDLFCADVWQSLMTGRPPAFSPDYVDCKFPTPAPREPSQEIPGQEEPDDELIYDNWAPRFALRCVSEVAQRSLAAEAPSYNEIMELDRKIREFPIPPEAITMLEDIKSPSVEDEPPDLSLSMQRFVLSHAREVVLLWTHRSYFAQAIVDHPSNPLRSPYAPSFLAAYRSSDTILKAIKEEFAMFPRMCSRFWLPWTFAFSAAVVFGTVVTRGPKSHLAGGALVQLDTACELFTKAGIYSRRAAKALPILLKLREKAHGIYETTRSDPNIDGTLWNAQGEDVDELAIFAGKTRLVESKRPSPVVETPPSHGDSQAMHVMTSTVGSTLFVPTPTTSIRSPQLFESGSSHSLHPPPILPSVPAISPVSGPSTPAQWPTQAQNQPSVSSQRQPSIHHTGLSYQPHTTSPDLTLPPISQVPPEYGGWTTPVPPSSQPHSQSPQPHPHSQHMSYSGHFSQQSSPSHLQHQFPEYVGQYGHGAGGGSGGYLREAPRTMHLLPGDSLGHHRGIPGPQGSGGQQPQHHHGQQQPTAFVPPQELVQLGLASNESRLNERWTNFMQQSGFLDGAHPGQYRS